MTRSRWRRRSTGRKAARLGAAALLLGGLGAEAAEQGEDAGPYGPLSGDPGLSLGEVVRAAVQRLPERLEPQAREREAEALERRAAAWLPGNPALAISHTNDAVGTDAGNREWEGGLEIPLWRPGQRSARRDLAEGAAAQAQAGREALRLEAAGRVRERLWGLALQRKRVAMARIELETAEALEEKVTRRFELGDLPRSEVLMARDRVVQKEAALAEARSGLRARRADYRRLTGLERTPQQWREPQAEGGQAPAGPEPYAELLRDHPALSRARRAVERRRAQRELAGEEAAESPSLMLGTRRERGAGGETVNSLQASLHIPLGQRTQTQYQRASAGVELAQAESRLARLRRDLRGALERAHEAVAAARELLRRARRREETAGETLEMARRAFEAGEYDLIDLLRVQDRYAAARQARAQQALELQRAIARYNQAAGEVPQP